MCERSLNEARNIQHPIMRPADVQCTQFAVRILYDRRQHSDASIGASITYGQKRVQTRSLDDIQRDAAD
jgi:hypothetical protein